MRAVAVGGLVAVGFLDEARVIVGSHSGIAVVDAMSAEKLGRIVDLDGTYPWFTQVPPSAMWPAGETAVTVPVAGLWGGELPVATDDGWRLQPRATGVTITGPLGASFDIDDEDDFRAAGFSPAGRVFVYATASTLYVAVR